jgi:hypothetical protein
MLETKERLMSRFLFYVIVVSVVVFPIAAILKPHSFHEVPVSGAILYPFFGILGVIGGAIVGLLGGVIGLFAAMSISALLGKRTANLALPVIGAIGAGGIGAMAWLILEAETSDPFLGSYWPIAGAISGAGGGLWAMVMAFRKP